MSAFARPDASVGEAFAVVLHAPAILPGEALSERERQSRLQQRHSSPRTEHISRSSGDFSCRGRVERHSGLCRVCPRPVRPVRPRPTPIPTVLHPTTSVVRSRQCGAVWGRRCGVCPRPEVPVRKPSSGGLRGGGIRAWPRSLFAAYSAFSSSCFVLIRRG